MDWAQVFTIIAANAGLFLWARSDSKDDLRAHRAEMSAIVEAIRQDMKDFHGRLERQDAEFKGKLALQDAEFKTHMIYHHTEAL